MRVQKKMRMISKRLDSALSDVLFFSDPSPIIALPCHSFNVEFCSNRCICQSSEMGFFKLLHGFVKIDTWNCQICHLNL